jgi:hypothetical protein
MYEVASHQELEQLALDDVTSGHRYHPNSPRYVEFRTNMAQEQHMGLVLRQRQVLPPAGHAWRLTALHASDNHTTLQFSVKLCRCTRSWIGSTPGTTPWTTRLSTMDSPPTGLKRFQPNLPVTILLDQSDVQSGGYAIDQ